MAAVEIRRIDPDETRAFTVSEHVPFLERLDDDEALARAAAHLEPERSWVGVDGGRFVANAAVLTRNLTVPGPPGASCPTVNLAAVTAVAVHPTHRRQGLLRRLMELMLDDARVRGEPLAGLFASESSIYGRFGFGPATAGARLTIRTNVSRFSRPAPTLALRVVDAEEAGNVLPALFERLRRARPGQLERNRPTWADLLARPVRGRADAGARFWTVGADGYVSYRGRDTEEVDTVVEVDDLYGATTEVEAGLWRFVSAWTWSTR